MAAGRGGDGYSTVARLDGWMPGGLSDGDVRRGWRRELPAPEPGQRTTAAIHRSLERLWLVALEPLSQPDLVTVQAKSRFTPTNT